MDLRALTVYSRKTESKEKRDFWTRIDKNLSSNPIIHCHLQKNQDLKYLKILNPRFRTWQFRAFMSSTVLSRQGWLIRDELKMEGQGGSEAVLKQLTRQSHTRGRGLHRLCSKSNIENAYFKTAKFVCNPISIINP